MLGSTVFFRDMLPSRARDLARRLVWTFLVGSCAVPSSVCSQALGTAFSYQGQLTESGAPATGLYDLQICLFDSPLNPSPIACAPDFDDVPVADGVFTVAIDFGAAVCRRRRPTRFSPTGWSDRSRPGAFVFFRRCRDLGIP